MQNAIRRWLELVSLANVICCVRSVSTSFRYAPDNWALYKNNKDGMCYYGSHSIREDYSGSGTYGQAYLNTMGVRTYIDCSAVE